jgi:hypothetical protein
MKNHTSTLPMLLVAVAMLGGLLRGPGYFTDLLGWILLFMFLLDLMGKVAYMAGAAVCKRTIKQAFFSTLADNIHPDHFNREVSRRVQSNHKAMQANKFCIRVLTEYASGGHAHPAIDLFWYAGILSGMLFLNLLPVFIAACLTCLLDFNIRSDAAIFQQHVAEKQEEVVHGD